MDEKPNTFEEMEKTVTTETPVGPGVLKPNKEEDVSNTSSTKNLGNKEVSASGEINVDDFSDTALKDNVKYVRPDLDGTEDVVNKFQVFSVDTATELKISKSKTSTYWPVQMLITYDSKNEDDINNREYISGAIAFQNKDGSASDISFWYDGCEHQSGYLWEVVAAAKEMAAVDLSPREFVAFLNSKPCVKLIGKQYKNYVPSGQVAKPNAPKHIVKNLPEFFMKA